MQISNPIIPDVDPWPTIEKLTKEKEVVGIYISGHPLDDFRVEMESFCNGDVSVFKSPKEFINKEPDITEENLQSRCRGVLLMALSNKSGDLVLTTGNKSETAVGYSTLYGDTAGGFAVLKDVPKTLVYRLADYRNTLSKAIPQRIIDRPPTAELSEDQKDSDSLPDYDVLDRIIEMYVEQDESKETIIEQGFNKQTVERVIKLIDFSEYKRRQAPLGVKITPRGFGKDRRYPITNKFFK